VLPRARTAVRLQRDLELSAAGTAVVLDLLAEIDSLRARLRRLGA
jgi:chaperone modulatory protein CbpM